MPRRHLIRLLGAVAGLLAVAGAWFLLAPAQLGGWTSYAMVVGNSMEPQLERGDLAVVRGRDDYRVGDVVLYDSRQLGAWVLHRIVSVDGGGFYRLKGDNNDFVDPERVGTDRIIGALSFAVPGAGGVAEWIRVPAHAALVVGLSVLLALSGGAGVGIALRRRARSSRRPERRRAPVPLGDVAPLLLGLGAAAVVALALAFVSFGRPAARTAETAPRFVQHGALAYRADVPRSPVYPDGRVASGQPVFLRLVPRLAVSFDYRLDSQLALDAHGAARLDARLSDGAGWERTFPVAPPRTFSGPRVRVAGTLDLEALQSLLRRVQELTGAHEQVYTLELAPSVTVRGDAGGAPFAERFQPVVRFDLGEERLQLADTRARLAASRSTPGVGTAPATLSLGPLSPTVRTVRWGSLSGLAAALLLAALAVVGALRRRTVDEACRIDARYGHLLVPVSAPGPGWGRATEIATFDGLARLAAQRDGLILHLATAGTHRYAVEDGSTVFLYRTGEANSMPPSFDEVPFFDDDLDGVLATRLTAVGKLGR